MTNVDSKRDFVAISDFHSYTYPLEKIKKYYLNEFNKIYILGDATDRGEYGDGTGGIELLQEIKELTEKYPGRVIYIPGNHDEFIIGYAKGKQYYDINLIRNGGKQTINDLNKLKETNSKRYYELIDWLGNLPLQRVQKCENKNYVFAHALFNQKLYEHNPNYCLYDYINENDKKTYKMVENVLWFRKGEDIYSPRELPSSDSIMIIGHTPTSYRNGSLDLEDIDGNMLKVHCVDGGIAYDGVMLKYVSGEIKPSKTYMYSHIPPETKSPVYKITQSKRTYVPDKLYKQSGGQTVMMPISQEFSEELENSSVNLESQKTRIVDRGVSKTIRMKMPNEFYKELERIEQKEKLDKLNTEIIEIVNSLVNKLKLIEEDTMLDKLRITRDILLNPDLVSLYCVDKVLREEMKNNLEKHKCYKKEISNYKGTKKFKYTNNNFDIQYYDYFKTVTLNYLIDCCIQKYGEYDTILLLNKLICNFESIYERITNSNMYVLNDTNISEIAKLLGASGIKRVLKLHNCENIIQYITEKKECEKSKIKKKS